MITCIGGKAGGGLEENWAQPRTAPGGKASSETYRTPITACNQRGVIGDGDLRKSRTLTESLPVTVALLACTGVGDFSEIHGPQKSLTTRA